MIMKFDMMNMPEPMIIISFDYGMGCDEDTGADYHRIRCDEEPEPMNILPFDNGIGCDEDTEANNYLSF